MLGNVDSSSVVWEFSAPNRSGLLFPDRPSEDGEDLLMLVMPVMLNA